MKKFLSFALICFLSACSSGSHKSENQAATIATQSVENVVTPVDATPVQIKLALNWFPEVEHAGYFTAELNDDYKRQNLTVEIIPGGPDVPVIQRVATGDVEFGIANADEVLLARAQKVPVVALMAPIQHSPLCLMFHKSSGVTELSQLKDMTLALSPTTPQALYLQKMVTLENVTIVPYTGSVAPFLQDPKSAQQGYIFSEPYVAKKQGADVNCLLISSLGYDPYASMLITSEKFLKDHPSVVQRMVHASIAGWKEYILSPDATHKHIVKINPQMDKEILKYGYKSVKPLVVDEVTLNNGLGFMSDERWEKLLSQLVEIGLIEKESLKAQDAFTAKFITEYFR